MLVNLWYVAQESRNVSDKPVFVRLLGQDLVLFRDKDGKVACLSDICVHRGASLSQGKVVDGTVECPFHGWRYAGDGRCTKIPAHPDLKVPGRARVDAYPVEERYGWVWVFIGDLPETERPPIPVLPDYDSPNWRFVHGVWDFKMNWERVVENGLDASHAPFVHGTAFGDPDRPEVMDFSIDMHEWGGKGEIIMHPPKPRGLWALKTADRPPVATKPFFHMCGPIVGLRLDINEKMAIWIYNAHTPVDEDNTRSWWSMGRTFLRSPWFDKNTVRRNIRIFEQDALVIENIRPVQVPENFLEEVTVRSDQLQMEFRRMVRKFEARGWLIDSERLAREFEGKRAVTLPCPGRREHKPWVLDNLPLKSRQPRASRLDRDDESDAQELAG